MQRINFQKPMKRDRIDADTLLVHSIFQTIQGEGPNVGRPAVFVRLGGCNLQCPGCDTEYTSGTVYMDPQTIVDKISANCESLKPGLVVITGGEPFRQNIVPLINLLVNNGFEPQIETNGTLPITNSQLLTVKAALLLQIVVSPKSGKVATWSLLPWVTAYKYVINGDQVDAKDGLPKAVLGMRYRPARPPSDFHGTVYIQPADENSIIINADNQRAAINSCIKHGYTLCIQTHKILHLE